MLTQICFLVTSDSDFEMTCQGQRCALCCHHFSILITLEKPILLKKLSHVTYEYV